MNVSTNQRIRRTRLLEFSYEFRQRRAGRPEQNDIGARAGGRAFEVCLDDLGALRAGEIDQTGGPKGKATYLYVAPPTAVTTTPPTQTPTGFTTYPTPRAPVYTTHLSEDLPTIVHPTASLYVAAKEIIDTSSRFKDRVKVTLQGDTLVLAGVVNTANERMLAEGVIRTAPGVNAMTIRNELVVAQNK